MKPPRPGSFALHLLDVGQGEAILMDLPNGAFALLDAGPPSAEKLVLDAVAARIEEKREFRFGGFTHWDKDHIGALPAILRAHAPKEIVRPYIDLGMVKRLCAQLDDDDVPRCIDELAELEARVIVRPIGARINIPDVGHRIEMHGLAPGMAARDRMRAALEVRSSRSLALGPAKKARDRRGLPRLRERLVGVQNTLKQIRNDISLVLWIHVFDRALLLTGDVTSEFAREMFDNFGSASGHIHHDDPRAVWIKLSHHGSKTGTSAELINFFAHDRFVASASHGAQYGHPHPRVLHEVRRGGSGHAMCTRLGKGCQLIHQDPMKYPSDDPSWTDVPGWRDGPSSGEHCYGTITVTVDPDSTCSVSGTLAERRNCPYGGPSDGRIFLPAPPIEIEA